MMLMTRTVGPTLADTSHYPQLLGDISQLYDGSLLRCGFRTSLPFTLKRTQPLECSGPRMARSWSRVSSMSGRSGHLGRSGHKPLQRVCCDEIVDGNYVKSNSVIMPRQCSPVEVISATAAELRDRAPQTQTAESVILKSVTDIMNSMTEFMMLI